MTCPPVEIVAVKTSVHLVLDAGGVAVIGMSAVVLAQATGPVVKMTPCTLA